MQIKKVQAFYARTFIKEMICRCFVLKQLLLSWFIQFTMIFAVKEIDH